jgi:membrane protein
MDWRRVVATVRTVAEKVRENNITFMAGSIAHSAFLSLLPLLLLLLVITVAVGNETLTTELLALSRKYLSPVGQGLLYEALTNASERAGASVIGIVTLLWGMLRVFRGLNTAFDELYGDGTSDIVEQLVDGVVVFVSIVLATFGTALGIALLAIVEHPVTTALNPLVLVAGLTAAFYPMFYRYPQPDIGYREALPGTLVAAVGWVLLELLFGLYVDMIEAVSMYGVLGSIILLLVWLYAVAFVLLVGAVVNLVLAGRHQPDVEAPASAA